jgi:hypothetical protein
MFETLLIKGFLSYFSDPVSEFLSTYHGELFDGVRLPGKRIYQPLLFYTSRTNLITQPPEVVVPSARVESLRL